MSTTIVPATAAEQRSEAARIIDETLRPVILLMEDKMASRVIRVVLEDARIQLDEAHQAFEKAAYQALAWESVLLAYEAVNAACLLLDHDAHKHSGDAHSLLSSVWRTTAKALEEATEVES